MSDELERIEVETDDVSIQVRDAAKREIEVRLLPWDTIIETVHGQEMFARGSFADTPNDGLMLMGMEHEARFGIGQDGGPRMTRHAVGRSNQVWEADDGPHAVFKVGRTAAGDDLLALAEDGIVRGVSAEFVLLPDGTNIVQRGGRRVRVHTRVKATGASLTYQPAYGERATVLAVRSQEEAVNETPDPTPPAPEPTPPPTLDLAPLTRSIEDGFAKFSERLDKVEENARASFEVPSPTRLKPDASSGRWMQAALKVLSGERLPESEVRVMADLITSDNLGVVPEAHLSQLIGVIDAGRPFLGSTERIPTPASGMTLNVPVITLRPTAGVQVNEKDDITSTETAITSVGFDAITITGGGDISLQLLKRSDPSYLELYLRLLAEAVSQNAEAEAIAALLASGISTGTGTIDFDDLLIGEAWTNAIAVRKRPDTMWLSSDAVAEVIDAKATGTNAPLYSNLNANFTVGGGPGGTISGLTPVYVPALDGTGTDVLIGPRTGFAWAEDGAFTLQVDVPSKLGRDVALAVIDWYCPLYPDAFTGWSL
jgi:HK97 family phage major capsid protein